jgi:hypothetical protein
MEKVNDAYNSCERHKNKSKKYLKGKDNKNCFSYFIVSSQEIFVRNMAKC